MKIEIELDERQLGAILGDRFDYDQSRGLLVKHCSARRYTALTELHMTKGISISLLLNALSPQLYEAYVKCQKA